MESEGLGRFRAVLEEWAQHSCRLGQAPIGPVALPTDFHPDEANGFLRALDAGIGRVTDSGRCALPSIHRASAKPTEPSLFSRRPDGSVYLAWREYITQVGAVASLVLDYGWPAGLVALDPRTLEFDVAGFASSAGDAFMAVAGETKKTQRELVKLLTQMDAAIPSTPVSTSSASTSLRARDSRSGPRSRVDQRDPSTRASASNMFAHVPRDLAAETAPSSNRSRRSRSARALHRPRA